MSLPVLAPLLQSALSIGTTVVGYIGANQQAKQQTAMNNAANEQARIQTIDDYDQLTRVGTQEKNAASQKLQENETAAMKTRATAAASASEAGVGGLSVGSLLADIYGQEASIRDGVNQNLESTQAQLGSDRRSTQRSLQNTISTRPPVNKPSLAGALIEGATGVYGAYRDNLRIKSQT